MASTSGKMRERLEVRSVWLAVGLQSKQGVGGIQREAEG